MNKIYKKLHETKQNFIDWIIHGNFYGINNNLRTKKEKS